MNSTSLHDNFRQGELLALAASEDAREWVPAAKARQNCADLWGEARSRYHDLHIGRRRRVGTVVEINGVKFCKEPFLGFDFLVEAESGRCGKVIGRPLAYPQ